MPATRERPGPDWTPTGRQTRSWPGLPACLPAAVSASLHRRLVLLHITPTPTAGRYDNTGVYVTQGSQLSFSY